MASDTEQETHSRYKAIVVPEFKSAIPPHLLAKLPEADRYLVEMVSKTEQANTWLMTALKDENEAKIELDVRLTKVEKWMTMLCNKWSLVALVLLIITPVVAKVVIERYWFKPVPQVQVGTQPGGTK